MKLQSYMYVQVFNEAQEKELAFYVKDMENRLFGLTTKDPRRVAYELAEENKLEHNFCCETKMAEKIWLEIFKNVTQT